MAGMAAAAAADSSAPVQAAHRAPVLHGDLQVSAAESLLCAELGAPAQRSAVGMRAARASPSDNMSIHEREGPMGLLKGAAPRVAAEGLRVLLGAPGIDATAIELDARARRRKALRKTGVSAEMLSVGNELLIELGRVLVVTAITHPLELVATRLMTEDDSMCDLELSPQPGTMF